MAESPLGVKIVGWLHILGGVFGILVGLGTLLLGGVMGLGGDAALGLGALTGVIGVVAIVFGAVGIYVGWSVLKLKPWARMVATVFGVLNLLGFPIGTVIGAVVLYFLWADKDTKAAFGVA